MTSTTTTNTALTDLATALDDARRTANAIEAAAPQRGVYGDIANALHKTLGLLLDDSDYWAEKAYQAILDGNTVVQALKIVSSEINLRATSQRSKKIRVVSGSN
ncbi:UNVERIFIED_ORG: hypothetical protein ABIB52_000817 [Arthrobacter sp. UYCu721]